MSVCRWLTIFGKWLLRNHQRWRREGRKSDAGRNIIRLEETFSSTIVKLTTRIIIIPSVVLGKNIRAAAVVNSSVCPAENRNYFNFIWPRCKVWSGPSEWEGATESRTRIKEKWWVNDFHRTFEIVCVTHLYFRVHCTHTHSQYSMDIIWFLLASATFFLGFCVMRRNSFGLFFQQQSAICDFFMCVSVSFSRYFVSSFKKKKKKKVIWTHLADCWLVQNLQIYSTIFR